MPSSGDPSLRDFGVAIDVPPPKCYRRKIVLRPGTEKIAGFICTEQNRGVKAYTTLRGYAHYYRNAEAFAVSDCILDALRERDVARVFIHDSRGDDGLGMGDVYEYGIHQYDGGEAVPADDLQHEWDPQVYCGVEDAFHVWRGLGNDLYSQTFQRACRRIDVRIDPTPAGV